jgi:hypothetical protein
MANVYAVMSGNWSDPTIWNTGALPTSADDVFSNTFVIDIDVSPTVLSVRNDAASGIGAGGSFSITSSLTLTCTAAIGTVVSAGNTLINVNLESGVSATIAANVRNNAAATVISIFGGGALTINGTVTRAASFNTIVCNGSGVLNINGEISSTPNATSNNVRITTACTVNIVGNITNGGGTSGNGACVAVVIAGAIVNIIGNVRGRTGNGVDVTAGTANITGNIDGGYVPNASTAVFVTGTGLVNIIGNINVTSLDTSDFYYSVRVNATGARLNIVGNITPTTFSAVLNSLGTLDVIGTVFAAATNPGVVCNGIDNFFSGPFVNNGNVAAVAASRMLLKPNATTWDTFLLDGDGLPTVLNRLYNLGEDPAFPNESDVRNGTSYGLDDILTGTMIVPPASSVAKDVPVDTTIGEAEFNAETFWNYDISNITVENSIGQRLKNVSTVATTGAQIAAFDQ